MTPFAYIDEVAFCFTMIAYLLAAMVGVVCFAVSVAYRLKPRYVLPEFFVSVAAVLLFCSLSDGIRIRYLGEDPSGFVGSPCLIPTWIVIVIAVVLFVEVACWLAIVVRKRLSSLTAMSVKEAISKMPVALCFYDETGRILLLNEQIARDSKELTGEPLYDGNAFWASVSEGRVVDGVAVTQGDDSVIAERADGRVSMCRRIAHDMDGKTVYELCCTDISREFMLKKEIEQKNENLRKMNLRLRKYGEIVAEVTKEKETLAARIKVHGNLGSLILRTKKELMQGEYDRASLIAAWNDILSLILAPDDDEQDRFVEADRTAASVGVRILYEGKRPGNGTQAHGGILHRRVRVRDQRRKARRRYRTLCEDDGERHGICRSADQQRQTARSGDQRGRWTFRPAHDDRKRRWSNDGRERAELRFDDNRSQGDAEE